MIGREDIVPCSAARGAIHPAHRRGQYTKHTRGVGGVGIQVVVVAHLLAVVLHRGGHAAQAMLCGESAGGNTRGWLNRNLADATGNDCTACRRTAVAEAVASATAAKGVFMQCTAQLLDWLVVVLLRNIRKHRSAHPPGRRRCRRRRSGAGSRRTAGPAGGTNRLNRRLECRAGQGSALVRVLQRHGHALLQPCDKLTGTAGVNVAFDAPGWRWCCILIPLTHLCQLHGNGLPQHDQQPCSNIFPTDRQANKPTSASFMGTLISGAGPSPTAPHSHSATVLRHGGGRRDNH